MRYGCAATMARGWINPREASETLMYATGPDARRFGVVRWAATALLVITLLTGPATAVAGYDFESLGGGLLDGQDGWVLEPGGAQVAIGSDRESVNPTQAARTLIPRGRQAFALLSRINDLAFGFKPFADADGAVMQMDVKPSAYAGFALGHDVDGDGRLTIGAGEIGPSFGMMTDATGGEVAFLLMGADIGTIHTAAAGKGDACCAGAGDWYRLQLRIDLKGNAGNGSGSLSYMNLSRGDTYFQPVSGLQDVNLELSRLSAAAAPRAWDAMWLALLANDQKQAASVDNLEASASPAPAVCSDVASRGYINVLTINLLFSQSKDERQQRYPALARFIAEHPVDVVLLQEVAEGILVDTDSGDDTAEELRDMLRDRFNVLYEMRRAREVGLPRLLSVGNAILSRCAVLFDRVEELPAQAEAEIEGISIKLKRNVLMVGLAVPGFGEVHAYDTHLCARCDTVDDLQARRDQLVAALDFVDSVEDSMPGDPPVIFGGDLNLDVFRDRRLGQQIEPEKPVYDLATARGLIDAYAVFHDPTLLSLCGVPEIPDQHCTVDVTTIDTSDNPKGRRVDYVFARGPSPLAVRDARVVFNTLVDDRQPSVSNHAGVLVSIELP